MSTEHDRTYRIVVARDSESGWLIATCAEMPGFVTQAESEEELVHNIKEAATVWLEVEREKSGTTDIALPVLRELSLSF